MSDPVCAKAGHSPGWFDIECGGDRQRVFGCTRCKLEEAFETERATTIVLGSDDKDAIEFMRALRALVAGYREVLDADTPERPKLWQDLYPPLTRAFELKFISRDLEDALCALVTALYNEGWGKSEGEP